jgi:hypothetical protein
MLLIWFRSLRQPEVIVISSLSTAWQLMESVSRLHRFKPLPGNSVSQELSIEFGNNVLHAPCARRGDELVWNALFWGHCVLAAL